METVKVLAITSITLSTIVIILSIIVGNTSMERYGINIMAIVVSAIALYNLNSKKKDFK